MASQVSQVAAVACTVLFPTLAMAGPGLEIGFDPLVGAVFGSPGTQVVVGSGFQWAKYQVVAWPEPIDVSVFVLEPTVVLRVPISSRSGATPVVSFKISEEVPVVNAGSATELEDSVKKRYELLTLGPGFGLVVPINPCVSVGAEAMASATFWTDGSGERSLAGHLDICFQYHPAP